MELQVVEANQSQKETAFRQVFDVWPCGETEEQHLQWRLNSVQHQRAIWYVGCVEGQVVCSLGAYPLTIRLDGEPTAAFAIGAVHTSAAHRGKGYAPRLISEVEQQQAASGARLAMLFSDIALEYYGRLGYQACPSHQLCAPATATAKHEVQLTACSHDIARRKHEYDRAEADAAFCLTRDDDYWRFLDRRDRNRSRNWRVAWRGREVGGVQLTGDVEQSRLILSDYAFTTDEDEFWLELTLALAAVAQENNCRHVAGWTRRVESLAEHGWLEPRSIEVTMLKPLDPTLSLSAAAINSCDRLREADHV